MEVSATVDSLLNASKETVQTTGSGELGKQEFLLLLVTQLKHQDPLDPLDGTQFVEQLATFTSLEELENINSNLEKSVESDYSLVATINNNLSASLIGKELKANDNTINHVVNQPDQLRFTLDGFATEVNVLVTDASGNIVDILPAENLEKGNNSIEWDGENLRGEKVLNGTYHFTVDARDAAGQIINAMPFVTGTISGVKFENNQTFFIVDGNYVPVSSVTEIIDV